jgi:hypothetical protein
MLAQLNPLLGDWDVSAIVQGKEVMSGRTTVEWIEDGAFVAIRADADPPGEDTPAEWIANSPLPTTTIVGLDDASRRFGYLYADARGVHRVYEMSMDEGVWRIWGRPGPDWFQRFIGRFSDDEQTIDARWETSKDGETWELDFELKYVKRA